MKLRKYIERPVLSTVISIILVLLGVISLTNMPVEQYPDIAPPTIRVSAMYPGANSETVINSVLAPLEEAINGVEGMDYMTSSAGNTGMASIRISFHPGVNPDMAQVNVQNRVNQALSQLPAEVTRSGVSVHKRQNSTLMRFYLVSPDNRYDPIFIQNYADINILPEILRVYGVGGADVNGAQTYTMRIWLDPGRMARYGLTPQDVVAALTEQNVQAAPGQLGRQGDQTYQYSLTTSGRLKTPEEFGNIILRATADGGVLHLSDIARVEMGALSYDVTTFTDGKNSISISVDQAAGSNSTQVIKDVEKILEKVENQLPEGLVLKEGFNSNDFLYASMWNVIRTLLEAFLLVMIVVFLFLQDFRSTLIPAIAIPVSLIGAFFIISLLGFSINILVLSALVLAIAIVVDDAIVVVEAVHLKLDQGYTSTVDAASDAMDEIAGAIVSITLVMMAVFLPVSFSGGITGTFYQQFGLTMAAAILFSGINALTLSPALCALLMKPKRKEDVTEENRTFKRRFQTAFNTHYDHLVGKYGGMLKRITGKTAALWAIVIVAAGLLGYSLYSTPTGFVPSEDMGTIMIDVQAQPGTSSEVTAGILDEVKAIVETEPGVKTVTTSGGFSIMGGGLGSSFGTVFVDLKPWGDRPDGKDNAYAIIDRLNNEKFRSIPDARVTALAPPTIPGFGMSGGFSMVLQDRTGGSMDDFYQVAQQFLGTLNSDDAIGYARTSFNPSFPMYHIDIDPVKLKIAGYTPQQLYSALQAYIGGMYVANFNAFGHLYRVYVQADPDKRAATDDLREIYVSNGRTMAPASQFVTLTKVFGPLNIDRFNLYNSINVMGAPAPGYSTGQAIAKVEEVAKRTLPAGYTYEYSGITREEQTAGTGQTAVVFLVTLIFIYLVLAAQYESYLLPLSVILSVPGGLAGSLLFVNLFGIDNNIYVRIAIIMLIGLLAKNAILIVEYARQRRQHGMSLFDAAIDAAKVRLRPILMTSLALIIGLLPLAFAHGAGANGYFSLGIAAIGGMLIGTLVQLVIVPGLYVIFERIQERFTPHKDADIVAVESKSK